MGGFVLLSGNGLESFGVGSGSKSLYSCIKQNKTGSTYFQFMLLYIVGNRLLTLTSLASFALRSFAADNTASTISALSAFSHSSHLLFKILTVIINVQNQSITGFRNGKGTLCAPIIFRLFFYSPFPSPQPPTIDKGHQRKAEYEQQEPRADLAE
jgi:hypothetical protein